MTLEDAREFFAQDRYATKATGIVIDEIKEGYSRVSLELKDHHKAAGDHVMGGVFYTIADFSFAVATNTPEHLTVTTNGNISYYSQPKDDRLIAECKVQKEGKRFCFYESTVSDGLGNTVAKVTFNGAHIS
ncbi:MAG: PaaI family thioesterase [Lachnospiraceae bacterium]|nr:PaaI family thioesterase [Lachnospiraceae bacterium]